jgi:dephospho-CoA kinase
MLVAVVGMPGSGKSEASGYLQDKHGFALLRFGDVIEETLRIDGRKLSEKNEKETREKIRKEHGMKAMAVMNEKKLGKLVAKSNSVVIDGLYSWEEYEYLKQKYLNLVLVAIYSPPSLRYLRLAKRTKRSLTDLEARNRDQAELKNLNKGGPIAMADHLVVNDEKVVHLQLKLDEIVGRINNEE